MADRTGRLTFTVEAEGRTVFESYGSWLHPLFELEEVRERSGLDLSGALIRDKVIGKAAALLMLRLGVGRVHGEVVSDLAIGVFESAGVPLTWDNRVERIGCRTEEILAEVDDPQAAYEILRARAGR